MISIKNTENLAGVTISGDYHDLYNLVEAFHDIAIDEYSDKYKDYTIISIRVLGICYDIRHAYQGDRDIKLLDNNMNEDKMRWHSTITPRKNVYYSCNCLYPEMFFGMLALNALIELRAKDLAKSRYYNPVDRRVIWDSTIATLRSFQVEFVKCVKETLSEATFSRWLKVMNGDYLGIQYIARQYVDLLNIKYLAMTKEKRLKSLSTIAKRLAEFWNDKDHREIKDGVVAAAKEYGCAEDVIEFEGIDYPDEIVW